MGVDLDMEQHGHPRFYELTQEENELHSKKNKDYAQGGDPLGNFQRVGSILSLYPGLDPSNPVCVALIYALKQFDAALWSIAQGYQPEVDSRGERFMDLSVYAKLARIIDEAPFIMNSEMEKDFWIAPENKYYVSKSQEEFIPHTDGLLPYQEPKDESSVSEAKKELYYAPVEEQYTYEESYASGYRAGLADVANILLDKRRELMPNDRPGLYDAPR